MSLRVCLHCPLNTQKTSELMQFLKDNLPAVRSFEGCLGVDVYFSLNKEEMLLEEQWETKEYHQRYIDFIANNGVLGKLRAYLLEDPDIKYFEKVL